MRVNLVNLPAALLTIVFRRIIDSRVVGGVNRTSTAGLWLVQHCLSKNAISTYIIGTALYYLIKHIRNGTLVNIARSCSVSALSIRNQYLTQRRWLERNKSWALRSLLSTRENQEIAISYLTQQIPDANEIPDEIMNVDENTSNTHISVASTSRKFSNNSNHSDAGDKKRASGDSKEAEALFKVPKVLPKAAPKKFKTRAIRVEENPRFNDSDISLAVSNKSCTSSELDVYTPSVINEIIPSDPEDQDVSSRNGRMKRKSLTTNMKSTFVRKTRSGRVYGLYKSKSGSRD